MNNKDKNNPNYKQGVYTRQYYCLVCGKKIHITTFLYGNNHCKSCAMEKKHLIGKYPRKYQKGKSSLHWAGGKIKNENGYVSIYSPEHPHRRGMYVFEHRLIMEKKLGRYLTKDELVHHINGIRDDNRIENLGIVSRKNHEKHTFEKLLQQRIQELEKMLSIKKVVIYSVLLLTKSIL